MTRPRHEERAAELLVTVRTDMLRTARKLAKQAAANREAYLLALTDVLRPLFKAAGGAAPARVMVSIGFPSRFALSKTKRRIGECWHGETVTEEGVPHVYIHPELPCHGTSPDDAAIDEVLVHELVHACGHRGHRGGFAKLAKAIGLTGKMTATSPTKELHKLLGEVCAALGKFPGTRLRPGSVGRRPQKPGRMLLMKCACPDGRPIRVSRMQADRRGFFCELCQQPWVLDGDPRPGSSLERERARQVVLEQDPGLTGSVLELETDLVLQHMESDRRVKHAADVLARLSYEELGRAMELLKSQAMGKAS